MLSIKNVKFEFTDENNQIIKYLLINSNELSSDFSAVTSNGLSVTNNIIINVQGSSELEENKVINKL